MFFEKSTYNYLLPIPLLLIGIYFPIRKLMSFLAFHPPPTNKQEYSIFNVLRRGDLHVPYYYLKSSSSTKKTLILAHGNGTNIVQMKYFADFLHKSLDVNVLQYEYAGYEKNEKPSESDVYESAEAAYHFLVNTEQINPKDIVIFGISIGTGPSCYLAEKYPIGGLILQTLWSIAVKYYTSILHVGLGRSSIASIVPFMRPYDMFCNIHKVSNVNAPTLIIHGDSDTIVPYSHGKEIYENAKNKFKFISVPGANHNDIFDYYSILDFKDDIKEVFKAASTNLD